MSYRENEAEPQHDDHHEHHIMSPKVLIGTWLGLMVLTGLTVAAIKVDFGPTTNLVVAMVIAVAKAMLVCLIFMHLWFDQKYNVMVFFGSVIFVVLFISITFIDTKRNAEARQEYDNTAIPTPSGRVKQEPVVSPVATAGSDKAAEPGEIEVPEHQKPKVPWPSRHPNTPRLAPTVH